jgi:hypothetical protein
MKKASKTKVTKPQPKLRDLKPRQNPKGGTQLRSTGINVGNHNETFVSD